MGTIIDGQFADEVCINGTVVNSAVKNGIKFYERSPEYFKFTIDTRQTSSGLNGTDKTFTIPTLANVPYNWRIKWGDGTTDTVSSTAPAAISHTYSTAGQYQIAIRPAGDLDQWFSAFSFNNDSTANRLKLQSLDSPLTVAMFAEVGATSIPDEICLRMFYNCSNVTLGSQFGFSQEWENITTVDRLFCAYMFYNCSNLTALPENFNLPQNITSVDYGFCGSMFQESGITTLPAAFTLPQNITTVGAYFCIQMFYGCSNLTVLPANFNLPQNITSAGSGFCQSMFYGCSSLTSLSPVFTLPQSITTVGSDFYYSMFYNCRHILYCAQLICVF